MNENYVRPNIAALLAKALFEAGSVDEAESFADIAAEIASTDDVDAQLVLRSVRARVLSARGLRPEAEEAAEEVVKLVRETDSPVLQADSLLDVSEVLEDAGRRVEVLEEARVLYQQKAHLVGIDRVDAALAESAFVG
jgi:ATP/maltotriose-dependent transcriptional regulator MalT